MAGMVQRGGQVLVVVALALVLVGAAAVPARAHTRVIVGGTFGVPVYPPYPYYYPYYPYPYPPYSYAPAVPPPGWDPGHWEWRYDAWGRPLRVWVPAHLR
jgi:hypothetical protein